MVPWVTVWRRREFGPRNHGNWIPQSRTLSASIGLLSCSFAPILLLNHHFLASSLNSMSSELRAGIPRSDSLSRVCRDSVIFWAQWSVVMLVRALLEPGERYPKEVRLIQAWSGENNAGQVSPQHDSPTCFLPPWYSVSYVNHSF